MIVEAVGRSLQGARWSPRHAATPTQRKPGAHVAALALIALLVPLHRWWAAQVAMVPLLLVVPGVILLRALRVPGEVVAAFPVYVPCASMVVIFGSGLAADMVGPLAGVAAPLRTLPVLISLEIVCLTLLAASVNAPPEVALPWRSLSRYAALSWPLILPLIAAAGALRLNSSRGAGVALMAVCGFVALLVIVAALSSRLDESLLRVVVYAAGLSVSWSYSLRGDGVYGFDIATEYQRLEQTIQAGVWHVAHPNDAYGAMLSVTVMPAQLHALSGMSGLLIFKVIYPMLYALFPVAIFDLARRVLSRPWAFVGTAFTIGQYAFTEIPSLARQEIALVLFVALLAAMLDARMQRRTQWALIALLGIGMALSHYSTTYVAVTLIGLTIALQWAVSWFREIPRITGAMAVAFAATSISAAIWYVPVTHSDSHLQQVAQTVQAQGLNLLPNRVPGGSLISAYLQGNTKTPIQASAYEAKIHTFYLNQRNFIKPPAGASDYVLHDSPVPEPTVKWRLGYDVLGFGLLIIEQLANVLAALGALIMVARRNATLMVRQIGLLALVTTVLLTLLRFSGTLAVTYGQERAQLQGLVLFAIALCWTGQGLAGTRKARQACLLTVTTACLTVILVNTSYLVGAVLGGGTSANLANSGSAFEYFDTTTPELASAKWLGQAAGSGELVYADEYGQLRLVAMTRIQDGLILDLTPVTLNKSAWVYASRTNIIDGRAFALYNEHFAAYVFPADFLGANYDLVYTNGSSEVYHR
jgi:uncharacterized membrane protein